VDYRKCKKCMTAKAVVLVNKNGGTVDWWYCDNCLHIVMGEEPLGNIRWRREGIPDTPAPDPIYPFIP